LLSSDPSPLWAVGWVFHEHYFFGPLDSISHLSWWLFDGVTLCFTFHSFWTPKTRRRQSWA
jgi:hypothetical protein